MERTFITLFIALTTILFVSCEKELTNTPAGETTGTTGNETTGNMTIRASIADMQTRTTIDYTTGPGVDYTTGEVSKWIAGDQIRVYFYDESGTRQSSAVFKAKTGGTNVEFKIDDSEISVLPTTPGTYTVRAVYPKDAVTDYIYPGTQDQTGTDLSHLGDYALMTAQGSVQVTGGSATFDLAFTHRLPLLRFSLLNDTGGDITISEIRIKSKNITSYFLRRYIYDIDDDVIDVAYSSSVSLNINSSPTIADGTTFDAYMISGNTLYDDTDEVIITITFNDGTNDGTQEFTIPMATNAFLQTPFESGKRYYFKLKLTGADIVYATFGDLEYQLNTLDKRATVLGLSNPATSITIPATVSYGGENYDVVEIQGSAFAYRNFLTAVAFAPGSKLTTIGSSAFEGCTSLGGSLAIPASVITIGYKAFLYTALTGLTIEGTSQLTTIEESAFSSCASLTGPLAIPASVTTIGSSAFAGTALTAITFDAGSQLTTIEPQTFAYNSSLIAFDIPALVTNIGTFAFSNTGLTTINMYCTTPPTIVSSIFSGVSGLTIKIPSAAAAAYEMEINNQTKGWSHSTGAVTLNPGGSVTLSDFNETTTPVTVSATL